MSSIRPLFFDLFSEGASHLSLIFSLSLSPLLSVQFPACPVCSCSDAQGLHVLRTKEGNSNGARRQLQRPRRHGDGGATPRRAAARSKAAAGDAFVAELGPSGPHFRSRSGCMQGH